MPRPPWRRGGGLLTACAVAVLLLAAAGRASARTTEVSIARDNRPLALIVPAFSCVVFGGYGVGARRGWVCRRPRGCALRCPAPPAASAARHQPMGATFRVFGPLVGGAASCFPPLSPAARQRP